MDATQGEGVRTVDQVRAARVPFQGNVPGVGRSLELGELEEIEADARAGRVADPSQVLAMVRTIQSLARRTYVRFAEAVEARERANGAERRAEEMAVMVRTWDARVEELTGRVSNLSEWVTLRDGELASANEQRDAARREVEELKQSLAARDSLLAEATKERDEARRERDAVSMIFQASEAELVSAPLRRQVEELKQSLAEARKQRDERYTKGDLDRHFARHVQRADYWAKVVSDISSVLSTSRPALDDALRTTWETRTARAMKEVIHQIRDILEKPMEGPPGPPEAQ